MNRFTKTERTRNPSSYKLSAVLQIMLQKTHKSRQLKWPKINSKPTNRVQRSQHTKPSVCLQTSNDDQHCSHYRTQKNQKYTQLSTLFVSNKIKPFSIVHNNKAQVRSKSKKKIDLTTKAKSLNYTHSKKQLLEVSNYIQEVFNKMFFNSQGCHCKLNCIQGQFMILWSQSYKIKTLSYQQLKTIKPDEKYRIQIDKDISRTQPQVDSFKTQKYLKMLENILKAYSVEDKQVGYVQGMNIIVSGLLYHIKIEQPTFWVFCKLMKEWDVRDLFLENFERVNQHLKILNDLVQQWINDLHRHLVANQVMIQQVCFSWVLTLMSVLISVDFIHEVYEGFINQKWKFLYKVIIAYLLYLKQDLMSQEDTSGLLVILSVNYGQSRTNWKQVIQLSKTLKLKNQ